MSSKVLIMPFYNKRSFLMFSVHGTHTEPLQKLFLQLVQQLSVTLAVAALPNGAEDYKALLSFANQYSPWNEHSLPIAAVVVDLIRNG